MDSNHRGVIQRVLLLPPPAPTTGAPPTMRIPKMLRSKDSNLDGVIRSSRLLITSTHHWAVSPIPPDLNKWRLSIPTAIALYDGHPRLSFLRDGTGTLRRDLFPYQWSERRDLNPRSLEPEPSMLPDYTTPRKPSGSARIRTEVPCSQNMNSNLAKLHRHEHFGPLLRKCCGVPYCPSARCL